MNIKRMLYDDRPEIIKQYARLKRTPSGERHARRYRRLKSYIIAHQDDLLDILIHWQAHGLKENEVHELAHFGGHGGSVAKEYNAVWHGFMERLRENKADLPKSLQGSLDWLLRVHDW